MRPTLVFGRAFDSVTENLPANPRSNCTLAQIGHDLSPKLPGCDLADSKLPTDLAKRLILESKPYDRLAPQVRDKPLATATASQGLLATVLEPSRPLIAT